jgi:hypothetical protein
MYILLQVIGDIIGKDKMFETVQGVIWIFNKTLKMVLSMLLLIPLIPPWFKLTPYPHDPGMTHEWPFTMNHDPWMTLLLVLSFLESSKRPLCRDRVGRTQNWFYSTISLFIHTYNKRAAFQKCVQRERVGLLARPWVLNLGTPSHFSLATIWQSTNKRGRRGGKEEEPQLRSPNQSLWKDSESVPLR